MKQANSILLFFIAILLLMSAKVPVSNTLSDFVSKFNNKYIALYESTTDAPEVFRVVKFGHNEDIDAGTNEDIWDFASQAVSSATMTYPTTAQTLTVFSSNVNDVTAGTGAQTIDISCIQSDGTEITFEVIMNGTTPVVTTQTCLFVNNAAVTASGTGQKNAGDISIRNNTDTQLLSWISADDSQSHQIQYRVPSDQRCSINTLTFGANKLAGGAAPRIIFKVLLYKNGALNTERVIMRELVDTATESIRRFPQFRNEALVGGDIINIEADTNTNATQVSAILDMTCRTI